MIQLSSLIWIIRTHKKILHKLPTEIVNYTSSEKIEDDLTNILRWERYNQTFVSLLNGKLKGSARKDSELQEWISNLDEDNKKDLYDNFLPKVARYDNYSEFKNDINKFLNKTDDLESILLSIGSHKDTYIVYNKGGIIVAEVFSQQDSCEIGSSSWCISGNRGTYWDQYAGVSTGNKQYFLWNLNVPTRDIDSQVGITIKKGSIQSTSHLKNDKYVDINEYCKKYDIPRDIFTSLGKEDMPKLIEANEMDLTLGKALLAMGIEVASKYKHLMTPQVKLMLGLLTDEELLEYGSLDKYKEVLYRDSSNDILHSLMYYLNNIDYTDDTADNDRLEVNDNLEHILQTFNFVDKMVFLKKYQGDFRSWERSDNSLNYLDDDGLNNLFRKDIKEIKEDKEWELKVEHQGTHTDDVDFIFTNIDIDEYSTIMNMDEDTLYRMEWLDGNDFLYDSDEEWKYIHYHFTDEIKDKLVDYLNYIKGYLFHPDEIKHYNDLIEKVRNNDINDLEDFTEIISTTDPRFSDGHNNKSYIEEYMEDLGEFAQDLVDKDSELWDNDKLGTFDNDEKWEIEYKDILKNIEGEEGEDGYTYQDYNHKEFKSLLEWIDSKPGELSTKYHFDDAPQASSYYEQADSKMANKNLLENLEEAIDNENNDDNEDLKDNLEDNKDFKEDHQNILKNGYEPISIKSRYSGDDNWYGYRSRPIDLKKKMKVGNKEEGFKEVPTKSIQIIPINQINGGEVTIYTVNMDIETHGSISSNNITITDLTKGNQDKLKEIGVTFDEVGLESFSDKSQMDYLHSKQSLEENDETEIKNPNQLELNLESRRHLKSFKKFFE